VGNITDLSNSSGADILPARGLNGTYNEQLFTAEARRLILKHGERLQQGLLAPSTGFYLCVETDSRLRAQPPASECLRLLSACASSSNRATVCSYLAYHNVHGATNDDAPQQAPRATVQLYNTTRLDTYKVAGAMITKLDDGVGAVYDALAEADMLSNAVIAFCSDNVSRCGASCGAITYPDHPSVILIKLLTHSLFVRSWDGVGALHHSARAHSRCRSLLYLCLCLSRAHVCACVCRVDRWITRRTPPSAVASTRCAHSVCLLACAS
jgi:hypothetical protein